MPPETGRSGPLGRPPIASQPNPPTPCSPSRPTKRFFGFAPVHHEPGAGRAVAENGPDAHPAWQPTSAGCPGLTPLCARNVYRAGQHTPAKRVPQAAPSAWIGGQCRIPWKPKMDAGQDRWHPGPVRAGQPAGTRSVASAGRRGLQRQRAIAAAWPPRRAKLGPGTSSWTIELDFQGAGGRRAQIYTAICRDQRLQTYERNRR